MKKRKLKVMNVLIAFLVFIVFIIILIFIFGSLKRDFKIDLKDTSIEVGEDFKNEFKATYKGIDVTSNVKVSSNINNDVAGVYTIQYSYEKGSNKYVITKKIKVLDHVSPIISLKGGKDIVIMTNEEFKDPGFVALDNSDGDITENVVISGEVDTTKDGEYTIKYYVSDKSGNDAEVIRKITVTSSSPLNMDVASFTLDGLFETVTLKETKNGGDEYINDVIIAGDSMALYYVINEQILEQNLWYQVSITAETALTSPIYINNKDTNKTFVQNFKNNKPELVIMTLGTNSVAYMTPEYFYEKYYELIKEIQSASPNTKLIIQTIPPVDKSLDDKNSPINNDKINKFNYYIGKMCEELNIKFLNSASVLKNQNGTCKEGYCSIEDGIHPTIEGQKVLIEFAKTHMLIDE